MVSAVVQVVGLAAPQYGQGHVRREVPSPYVILGTGTGRSSWAVVRSRRRPDHEDIMTVGIEQQSLGHAAQNVPAGRVEAPAAEDDEVGTDGVGHVCDPGGRLSLDQVFGDHGSDLAAQNCCSCQRLGAGLAMGGRLMGQCLGTRGTDRSSDHEIRNDAHRVEFRSDSNCEARRSVDHPVSGRGVMGGHENRRLHGPHLARSACHGRTAARSTRRWRRGDVTQTEWNLGVPGDLPQSTTASSGTPGRRPTLRSTVRHPLSTVVGMNDAAVIERVRRLSRVEADSAADPESVEEALVAAREVSAWVEARQAGLIARLSSQVSFPEAAIAKASMSSLGHATKSKDRSETLGQIPNLADRLGDGVITAGHVDVVTRCSKQLDDRRRSALFDRVDRLADVAAAATVDEFAKRVRLETTRLQADDGLDRLERQKANTRLSTWVDAEGMWNLRGRFDPVIGVNLAARLDGAVDTLFAERVPKRCPTDPIEKQRFLAAHALARLVDGAATGRSGRPEYVVVLDADAPGEPGPVAEWSIPVEIPARVLAELAGVADITAVVVRNGVVVHAPGELNLGRTTRLANRAQRRALHGLYRSCAIPGCTVGIDRCELHHIIWWRRGGRTDLDNLVPICTVHHGKIHHDGWIIELGPRRELSLRLPDGTVHTTGPPGRRAAA